MKIYFPDVLLRSLKVNYFCIIKSRRYKLYYNPLNTAVLSRSATDYLCHSSVIQILFQTCNLRDTHSTLRSEKLIYNTTLLPENTFFFFFLQGIYGTQEFPSLDAPEVNDVDFSKEIIKLYRWWSSQWYSAHPKSRLLLSTNRSRTAFISLILHVSFSPCKWNPCINF